MKKLFTIAVLAAAAASCTQSEVEELRQNEYIGIASAKVNSLVQTRAGDGTPLQWGSLGLFVTSEGNDIFKVDNMKWNYDESGWASYGLLAYEGNDKQTAYAYHPYRSDVTSTTFNFTLDTYRWGEMDLLWWKSEGKLISKTLNIDFGHALSKLTIKLKKNEEVQDEDLSDIKVGGLKLSGKVNLITQTWNTDEVDATELSNLYEHNLDDTESFDKAVGALLIPQTTDVLTISVKAGSKTYIWETSTPQEFKPGYAYTMELTVGREVTGIGNVTVSEWTEEQPKEGNADYASDYLTGNELRTYMEEQLANNTDITVNLKSNAGYADFRIIRDALQSADVEDGTINLTITGAVHVPDCVFSGNEAGGSVDELKSISLPDVLEIGHSAFYYCNYLESVDAPKVQKIGGIAFADSENLISVDFPEVLEMGGLMFRGAKLESLDFPKLKHAEGGAFRNMPSLTSVNLPEIKSFSSTLFTSCEALKTVSAPKVTQIGDNVFGGCTSIETVQLTAAGDIVVSGSAWDIHPDEGESNPVNGQIDLILNKDKKEDVTNDNEWNGFTFKSITFEE